MAVEVRPRPRLWTCSATAGLAWLTVAVVTWRWPDKGDVGPTAIFAAGVASIGVSLLAVVLVSRHVALPRLRRSGPWLVVLSLLLCIWEIAAAKLALLPRPFFAAPQSVLEVYFDDGHRLVECTVHSLVLLGSGYALGALLGFTVGVAMG